MVTIVADVNTNLRDLTYRKLDENQRAKWTIEHWNSFLANIGRTPFNMLDEDNLCQLIYAKCMLHEYNKTAEKVLLGLDTTVDKKDLKFATEFPEHGEAYVASTAGPKPGKVQAWGFVEETIETPTQPQPTPTAQLLQATKLSNFAKPAPMSEERLQPTAEAKKELHENYLQAQGAPPNTPEQRAADLQDIEEMKAAASNPVEQQWLVAEKLANKSNEELANVFDEDSKLYMMVMYIRRQIKEGAALDKRPESLLEIFWPMPPQDTGEIGRGRYDFIMGRINTFLGKTGLVFNPEADRANVDTNSYRLTLASRDLLKSVSKYVTAYRTDEKFKTDPEGREKELSLETKNLALQYAIASQPIEAGATSMVGPVSTLDPNYFDYIRLVDKYGVKRGTLLHESPEITG